MSWATPNDYTPQPRHPGTRTFRIFLEIAATLGARYYRLLAWHGVRSLFSVLLFSAVFYGGFILAERDGHTFQVLFCASLVGWACLYFEPFLQGIETETELKNVIRRTALHVVHAMPLDALEPMYRGEWIHRVVHDLGEIESFLLKKIPRQLIAMVIGAGSFALSLVGLGAGAVWLLLLGAAVLAFSLRFQKRFRIELLVKEALQKDLDEVWSESLSGIRTVHIHHAEAYFQRRYDEASTRFSKLSRSRRSYRYLKMVEPLAICFAIAVVLSIAGLKLLQAEQALSLLFALPLLKTAWETGKLLSCWADMETNLSGFATQMRTEVTGSNWGVNSASGLALTEKISLEEAFWETSEDWAGPLDWTVRRGEIWIVTGPSDSGKSSLLEVFAGLRTLSGGRLKLHVDGNVTSEDRRVPVGLCSYVEQHPFIFKGTIRENLLFGHESRLSDAILWRTLERVGLNEWVHELGGLDSEFEAHGRELLKAEKYRIALCRALLLNRPFLLLDEPYLHFDDKTIRSLSLLLEEEKHKRGIIIVSRFIPKEARIDGMISVTDFETKRSETWGSITRLRSANPSPV